MYRHAKVVLAIAASAALCVTAAPGFATAANTLKDVFVTNTASDPVPTRAIGATQVAGSVDVGNLPAVQQVAGTVQVAPQGIRPLQIGSSPFNTDREEIADGSFAGTAFFSGGGAEPVVPEGFRFVVEHVSGEVRLGSDAKPRVLLRLGDVVHHLGPVAETAPGRYVFGEQLTGYLARGEIGQLTVNRFPQNSGDGDFAWAISGRLVPVS